MTEKVIDHNNFPNLICLKLSVSKLNKSKSYTVYDSDENKSIDSDVFKPPSLSDLETFLMSFLKILGLLTGIN